ncbi:cation diffusion facilitator family transporter [Gemmatimonadota bacterium]
MNVQNISEADMRALRFGMNLSLVIGLGMLVLKILAWLMTGSSAIFSDAAESVVHVVAVTFAAYSLRLSFKPADDTHLYGHAKISFFSAGFEGGIIVVAALFIIHEAMASWLGGIELQRLGLGAGLTAAAGVINGGLGFYLIRLGRKRRSLILEANGRHVLTDCWTSLGVVVGLTLALVTDWLPFDPLVAILVAINILISGIRLMRQGFGGLMDRAEPEIDEILNMVLQRETGPRGLEFHDLRHRNVGDAHWVEVHLLFPGGMSVEEAHRIATMIEETIKVSLDSVVFITTHLEALEDHSDLHGNPDRPPQNGDT